MPDGGADAEAGAVADAGDPGPCPTDPKQALQQFLDLQCPNGWEPYKVVSGPMTNPEHQCCYMVYNILCGPGGRPYLVDEGARVAVPRRGSGAGGWIHGDEPSTDGLSPSERASLAEAWTRDALLEHASVASFARFSLALLAAGAPADLVALAHQAALDEVQHARLCFALASRYAGEEIAPGQFPLGREVSVDASLASIAVSTIEEGCIGETMAAVIAAEQLARAADPAVRAALARIAADEARHAELAWRTVAWAVQAGGSEVRAAVERALVEAIATAATSPSRETAVAGSLDMEAHGRLDAATTAQVVASAMADIVVPAASTLLQRPDLSAHRRDGSPRVALV
jgi:hypothetical protein